MPARISLDKERLADFCRRHRIRKLSLFGSVLRDDFGPDSDVDFLVEFEPGVRLSLFDLVEIEEELSNLIGRKADLREAGELSKYFRQQVLESAEVQYVAA